MAARWLPVLVAVTLTLGGSARATDYPRDTLKLILRQNTATGKAKAIWVSKSPPPRAPPLSLRRAWAPRSR